MQDGIIISITLGFIISISGAILLKYGLYDNNNFIAIILSIFLVLIGAIFIFNPIMK